MTSYDFMPYPKACFPRSAPANLSAISQLFALTPVDIQKARVLEIGCAGGGNLLPLCARFPKARFTGIDLSKTQIAEARRHAIQLRLSNVNLIAASITEHDFGQKTFDYIIAHGVYSWVPKQVQNRLLQICGDHLSKNGVAFVSYNTLPGWNGIKTIRDMMMYHTQNLDTPAQKISEARNMLAFVTENMSAQAGPYKQLLENEIQSVVSKASDNYLFHEYLEAVNDPCYFHEFTDRAAKYGLSYLGESNVNAMPLGNHNEAVSQTLSQIDDPVRSEQYLDFVMNRRFRQTLLVKDTNRICRQLSADRLGDLRFVPQYRLKQPTVPDNIDKIDTLELVPVGDDAGTVQVAGHLLCIATLEIFKASPNRLSLADIAARTATALPGLNVEEVKNKLGDVLLKSVFSGIFKLWADHTDICAAISEKPALFAPAIISCQSMNVVPNQYHENINLSDDQRLILPYINGENTIDDICDHVKRHIGKGDLTLQTGGRLLGVNDAEADGLIRSYVEEMLNICLHTALLVG